MHKKLFLFLIFLSSHSHLLFSHESDAKIEEYILCMQGAYEHITGHNTDAENSYQILLELEDPELTPEIKRARVKLLFDRENYPAVIAEKEYILSLVPDEYETPLYLGQAYLSYDKPKEAITLLEKLNKTHENNENIMYYLASAYLRTQQFYHAESIINKLLARKELRNKHFMFYFLQAKRYFLEGNFPEAIVSIDHALELYPSFTKGLLLKAILYEKQNMLEKSIEIYKSYLALQPRDLEIRKKMVTLYFGLKNYDAALTILEAIPENSAEYYHDLALVYHKKNNNKNAYKYIDRSLALNKNFHKARFLKTHILLSEKKYHVILDEYQQTLENNPEQHGVIKNLLRLETEGLPRGYIAPLLDKIIKRNPQAIWPEFAAGDYALSHNNLPQAEGHYQKLLNKLTGSRGDRARIYHLNSDQIELLKSQVAFQMATISYQKNNYSRAHIWLDQAEKPTCVYPSVYNLRAYMWAETEPSKLSEALHEIDKAIHAHDNTPFYLDTKGYIYLKMGNRAEAKKYFQEALNLSPHDEVTQGHLMSV